MDDPEEPETKDYVGKYYVTRICYLCAMCYLCFMYAFSVLVSKYSFDVSIN